MSKIKYVLPKPDDLMPLRPGEYIHLPINKPTIYYTDGSVLIKNNGTVNLFIGSYTSIKDISENYSLTVKKKKS